MGGSLKSEQQFNRVDLMSLSRQKVEDYLMTIDTTQSMSMLELHDKVDAMMISLLDYPRVYFVTGEDSIDVYGERLENDEEYNERIELETSYRAEVKKWLEEAVQCAETK